MGWQGPMTGRQFEAWQAFLSDEQYEPSSTDMYLVKLLGRLDHLFAESGTTYSLDKYVHQRPKATVPMTLEQATRASKARLWAVAGKPRNID